MLLHRLALAAGCLLAAGCGAAEPAPRPAAAPVAAAPPTSDAVEEAPDSAKVSLEVRRALPRGASCESGDVCGFFLLVVSPGSDAAALARTAAKAALGKCGGHVIVYRDPRNVLGAGTVLPSAEAKRACEKQLGRDREDPDFPSALVFRVEASGAP